MSKHRPGAPEDVELELVGLVAGRPGKRAGMTGSIGSALDHLERPRKLGGARKAHCPPPPVRLATHRDDVAPTTRSPDPDETAGPKASTDAVTTPSILGAGTGSGRVAAVDHRHQEGVEVRALQPDQALPEPVRPEVP